MTDEAILELSDDDLQREIKLRLAEAGIPILDPPKKPEIAPIEPDKVGYTSSLFSNLWFQSGGRTRPCLLLHWGPPLKDGPTGLSGEAAVRTALAGLPPRPPAAGAVVDPFTGKGLVSRAAHGAGLDFVGADLNPRRLRVAATWLLRCGYRVVDGALPGEGAP
jgi:hypothetical protein